MRAAYLIAYLGRQRPTRRMCPVVLSERLVRGCPAGRVGPVLGTCSGLRASAVRMPSGPLYFRIFCFCVVYVVYVVFVANSKNNNNKSCFWVPPLQPDPHQARLEGGALGYLTLERLHCLTPMRPGVSGLFPDLFFRERHR